jgi:hypothetical protein
MARPEIVSQQGSAQPIACDATSGSAPDAVAGWSWGGALVPSVTWPAAVHEGSGKWPVSLLPDERSYQARPTTAPKMTTTPMAIR